MKSYRVGVYIGSSADEEKLNEYLTDEIIIEIENIDDIYLCDERAVLITQKVYEQMSIKRNTKIPSKESAMADYDFSNAVIVIVDTSEDQELAYGCISGEQYKKIKKCLHYGLEFIGLSNEKIKVILQDIKDPDKNGMDINNGKRFGAIITNHITDDFYDRDLPVVEKYHNLCIINCCENLTEEDMVNIKVMREQIQSVFIAEYICLLAYEGFVAEDGRVFDNIRIALQYAENQEWIDEHYIVEKVDLDTEETIYKFWYNKKLQLVGYEIVGK